MQFIILQTNSLLIASGKGREGGVTILFLLCTNPVSTLWNTVNSSRLVQIKCGHQNSKSLHHHMYGVI